MLKCSRMPETERNWLISKRQELVEVSVKNLGHQAIDKALPMLAKNFSPEECADIVLAAFRKIVENPNTRADIIAWVKDVQSENNPSDALPE